MKKEKKSPIIPYPEGIFYVKFLNILGFFLCVLFFFEITWFITPFSSAPFVFNVI